MFHINSYLKFVRLRAVPLFPGMEDSSVWSCGVMQVGEWGESRNNGTAVVS